jgi:TPR repeat protein
LIPGAKLSQDDLLGLGKSLNLADLFDNVYPFLEVYRRNIKSSNCDPVQRCDALRNAALNGGLYARLLYGRCFERGFGRPENYTKAVKHLAIAADRGVREAQWFLARLLQRDSNPESEARANMYLQLAVKRRDPSALNDESPGHATRQLKLYEQSADQGHDHVQLLLATFWLFKSTLQGNHEEDLRYLRQEKYHHLPILLLVSGLALHSMAKDDDLWIAADHFRIAAEFDLPVAQGYYAWVLENGSGVEQNKTRAAELYQKAVEGGYELAKDGLKRCTESTDL